MSDTSRRPARRILFRLGVVAATVLALGLPLAALPATAASSSVTVGNLVYRYDSNNVDAGATVIGQAGGSTSIDVPDTVTIDDIDYDVTAIGDKAFYEKVLSAVTIGDNVTSIGIHAFSRSLLTSLTLGNNVTTIGDFAFAYSLFTGLTIPDSVTTISEGAFFRNELTSLTIPDSVTTIGESAFFDNRLIRLALGSGVSNISHSAFSNNLLTSLTIPDSVTAIGDFAFFGNPLISLTIPDSVTTIGDYAFYGNQLTHLTIPDSVTAIGDFAFAYNLLTGLTLGNSVTTIGDSAFLGNQLSNVTIPGSVSTISDFAFEENPLTAVFVLGRGSITLRDADDNGSFPAGPGLSIHPECAYAADFGNPWHGYTVAAASSTVVFEMGGNGAAVVAQRPACGEPATEPEPPTEDGWLFTGWYADSDRLSRFDFGDPIITATTVYAGWVQEASPVITGPAAVTFTVGAAGSWTPDTLTGTPAPVLTATGLPDSLDINATTGEITGTPTAAGDYTVTVTADNGVAPAATLDIAVTVESGITTFTLSADQRTYHPGAPITITGGGLPAGTRVDISLHSTPVALGTVIVGGAGTFTLTSIVPAGISLGSHDIVATATVDGAALTESTAITIVAAEVVTPPTVVPPAVVPPATVPPAAGDTPAGAALPDTGVAPGLTAFGGLGLLFLAVGATTLLGRRRGSTGFGG